MVRISIFFSFPGESIMAVHLRSLSFQPSLYPPLCQQDFIDRYGDNTQYELIDGELVDLEPTGRHEEVAGFMGRKLNVAIDQQNLPYIIPFRCLVKMLGTETAFRPDLIILDQTKLAQEPLWQREPIVCRGESICLIVEVVSSNWQNDYARKVEDYALLGVPEYWIVDYQGLGGRDYIGFPKQPTVTICQLENDRYSKTLFTGNDRFQSLTFPTLQITMNQIVNI
jgi:Uma2 family endonuclease